MTEDGVDDHGQPDRDRVDEGEWGSAAFRHSSGTSFVLGAVFDVDVWREVDVPGHVGMGEVVVGLVLGARDEAVGVAVLAQLERLAGTNRDDMHLARTLGLELGQQVVQQTGIGGTGGSPTGGGNANTGGAGGGRRGVAPGGAAPRAGRDAVHRGGGGARPGCRG